MPAARSDLEPLHRLSLDEYHQLIESGGFDEDARIELLDGLLVEMSPKTPEHERAISALAEWLLPSLDRGRYRVGIASPLTLADGSEPEPDVTVVERDAPAPYHPATAALVIEVAVSSQRRDLVVKAPKYAAAGVPVYLVCDLDARRVIEHTDPTAGGYRSVREVGRLDPRLAGVTPLDVRDVFAAAFA